MATVENYQIQQTISIDFATPAVPPIVYAKQYDANMRVVAVNLYDSGAPYTVPAGYSVNIRLNKQDGNYVYNPALFGTGNTVFAILTQQMLTFPGELDAEMEVVSEDGTNVLKTATFVIACAPSVVPNAAIQSTSEYQTVQQLAAQVAANAQEVATNTQQVAENTQTVSSAVQILQENQTEIENIPQSIETMQDLVSQAQTAESNAAASAQQAATAVSGVQDNLTAHIDDKNNPHEVSAEQTGAEPAFTILPTNKGGTGQNSLSSVVVGAAMTAQSVAVSNYGKPVELGQFIDMHLVDSENDYDVRLYINQANNILFIANRNDTAHQGYAVTNPGNNIYSVQKITQSAYSALDPPDPYTVYFIVG